MAFADENDLKPRFAASPWLSGTSSLGPMLEFVILLAVAAIMHAVALDNVASPNRYFKSALARVSAAKSAQAPNAN
jgi:hypothetical protein